MYTPPKNLPVVGSGAKLLAKVESFVVIDWLGRPKKVVSKLTRDDLRPSDKGALSCFGMNAKGIVIVSMAEYEGWDGHDNPAERGPHLYVNKFEADSL